MSIDPAGLRRDVLREREAPGDLLRRWLAATGGQAIGYVLLAAGFLALVVGWFGVSREAIVAKQIPYLVSGGLGGAFLLGVGTLLLVVHELRLDNRRLEAVELLVEELRDALLLDEEQQAAAGAAGSTTTGRAPDAPRAAGTSTNGSAAFAVVAGGTRYHLPTCASTAGKEVTYLGSDSVVSRGLKPCRLCSPDLAPTA